MQEVRQAMQQQFQIVHQRIDAANQRQDTHFRWLMGTMITLIGMMAGVIITTTKLDSRRLPGQYQWRQCTVLHRGRAARLSGARGVGRIYLR